MKISIKTELIDIHIEDQIVLQDGYTKHPVPETLTFIKSAIEEAIKLHNEVKQKVSPN